jgi:nucleoside-diphosphate-sugar epimerase
MTVVIAGCGDLGSRVGLLFAASGHRVIGIRRSAGSVPAPIEGISLDLRTERPSIPADTEYVVVAVAAGSRTAEAYRATYLDGLANVLAAIDASEADPRVLLVSSTAVYDVTDGSIVDESTPADADTPTAAVLRETERLLHDRSPGAIVLRLGGIYGPGRERLINQVREGTAVVSTIQESPHTNRIHSDDAAAAIMHLLKIVAPATLYLGVDDEPARLSEVTRFIAAELGVAVAEGEVGSSREGGGDKRCSNALLRSTGLEFRYPTYREGYRALLG